MPASPFSPDGPGGPLNTEKNVLVHERYEVNLPLRTGGIYIYGYRIKAQECNT